MYVGDGCYFCHLEFVVMHSCSIEHRLMFNQWLLFTGKNNYMYVYER